MSGTTSQRFLEYSTWIDWPDEAIRTLAEQLFHSGMTPCEKAQTAYHFVRDAIPHSFDCKAQVITARASEVLAHKTGICHAKANLLAALLRLENIPAGFCYQHITLLDDDSKGYCLHCLNAIRLESRWVYVDARGNTKGKNACFSLEKPVLAFANRSGFDEYFFPGVYAGPDAPTMALLERATSLQEILDGLPDRPAAEPDCASPGLE